MKRHIQTVIILSVLLSPTWLTASEPNSIVAWGDNYYGQCNVPAPNTDFNDFNSIAGGYYHSLGLKNDGSIVAWGRNNAGQCNVPEPNTNFTAVAAGAWHSLGLKADGSIAAWGNNSYAQCDVPEPNTGFVAVAAGTYHSLGLRADGSIVAWGGNSYGQCNVPVPNSNFVAVAAGYYHSLGLKSDGSIVAWGYNYYGQCTVPAPNSNFKAIAAGSGHSLGLRRDGSIVAWGNNNYNQCNVPEPNAGFKAIAAGSGHSLGLKQTGSIVTWGRNNYGQCNVPSPNADFVGIVAGWFHSLGITRAGVGGFDFVAGNMMLINDNAGWCWYQDDKIIYDPVGGNIITSTSGGDLGFGGASGEDRAGDVDATTFNIATGRRTRVLMAKRGGDDHNMGGLWIRPDGRYLHLYCPHYSNPPNPPLTYYRVSANPHDGSAWDSEQSFDWSTISGIGITEGGQLTYTNLHYITGEGTGSGRLYDIVRWNNVTPNIAYSDNCGVTWQYMGKLNSQAGGDTYSNYYHKFRSNGVDRIDFIGVENHPRDNDNSVYHGYIKGGKGYNSFGVVVDDDLYDQDAPSVQAYTPIFVATAPGDIGADSYHTGWTNELELDKNGYPVCLYQTRYGTEPWGDPYGWWGNIGCADHRLFYGRFNGTSWTSTELAKMGPGLHWREQDYIGMGCIHPDDVNVVYISTHYDPRTDVNTGFHEIYKGVTYDNGLTWNWTAITSHSTVDNIRPAIPKWNANNTAVFWERGDFPLQGHFDMVLVGLVEEQGTSLGLVSYIDAGPSNTTNADGSPFSPTGPSGSVGLADGLWHEYTGYGNGGSCYTAGDGGTENAPALKTTITGLPDGTYDVFAYFWSDPNADWGVRGGFTSDANMLNFNKQSSQHAEASQFFGTVQVTSYEAILYRAYIGRKVVSGGASIDVYINDYDSSFANAPIRTAYDGLGFVVQGPELILSDCDEVQDAGYGLTSDISGDCYVNYEDLKIIADHWLNTNCTGLDNCEGADFEPDGDVDFVDFSDFALQWLWCNDPVDPNCTPNW